MNLTEKHLKPAVITAWDIERDRGVVRCGDLDLPVNGGTLESFTVSPHAGLAVNVVLTTHGGRRHVAAVVPALED